MPAGGPAEFRAELKVRRSVGGSITTGAGARGKGGAATGCGDGAGAGAGLGGAALATRVVGGPIEGSIASTSTGIEPRPRLPSFTAAV